MPGTEFRILPSLPLEFKKYRTILPNKLGTYMTKGWQLIASVNYVALVGDSAVEVTRFLIGKEPKSVAIRHPLPHLSFPQPEESGDPKGVIEEEPSAESEEEEDAEEEGEEDEEEDEEEADDVADDVKRDMDELLGEDGPKNA